MLFYEKLFAARQRTVYGAYAVNKPQVVLLSKSRQHFIHQCSPYGASVIRGIRNEEPRIPLRFIRATNTIFRLTCGKFIVIKVYPSLNKL